MLEFLAYLLGGTAIFEAGLLVWAVIIISGYRGYSSEYMRLVGKIRAETAVNRELAQRLDLDLIALGLKRRENPHAPDADTGKMMNGHG
jgi:hypothetical protein